MGQEAEESCCFRAPPAPSLEGEDHEPAPSGTEKFCVRALLLRASWSAAPAYWPARLRGWLDEVKGDTQVVSTASCAPAHHGSPLAITSILLSSCRLMWSRLRSLRRVLVVTLAPASRQTLAAALAKGMPRPRKTPAWAHASRWSPSGSRMRQHRQMRADRGNGRRRRRRNRTRKR